MKTIAFLAFLLVCFPVFSQDREMIFIAGTVTDVDTGLPVGNHEVYVTTNDSLFLLILTTNEAGLFRDTVEMNIPPVGYLYFYTFDCLQQRHDTLVTMNGVQIFVPFKICTDANIIKYNLGGFLFAGDYPINNPESTGDTAKAVLYRIIQDKIIPVDTLIFHELGYFWFAAVAEGTYMLKSQLLSASSHFRDYIPTYTGNQMIWPSVLPIILDRDLYHADIHLIESHDILAGPGSIQGTILFEPLIYHEQLVSSKNIQILLLDQNNQPLSFQFTDQNGFFRFSNLAYGTYKILAEQTGMYTLPVEVIITDANPAGNVTLSLYENNIFGIDSNEAESYAASILKVYPNPMVNDLQVRLLVKENSEFSVQLISSLGALVSQHHFQLLPGEHIIRYPFADLHSGLYLILLLDNKGKLLDSKKVVK